MRTIKFLLLLCFAATTAEVGAQSDPNNGTFRFLSMKFHAGAHHYTGNVLKKKLTHGYSSFEVRLGWQSKGLHDWEKEHVYPSYGIGFYNGYVGDIDIFGSPHAVFGFITFPFSNKRRHNFQVEPALGLTYNLKPYNPGSNPLNDAISSKLAVYFALHVGGKYRLNREIDLLYGYDLTHFSNGRTTTPNLGLNMMGFSGGLRYNFNALQKKVDNSAHPSTILQVRPTFPPTIRTRKIKQDAISIYQAIGTVQNKDDAGTSHRYMVSSTVLEYQHQFNTKHAANIGFDLFVDPSASDTAEYKANMDGKKFFPGMHIGYDFMFWRLSLRVQIGYCLSALEREMKGSTFFRPALRYQISNRLFAQLGLKTMQGGTADWVEWGLGFKIWNRPSPG